MDEKRKKELRELCEKVPWGWVEDKDDNGKSAFVDTVRRAIPRLLNELERLEAQRDKLLHWERHTGPEECPSWHDTCHCSPDTCKDLWDQLDIAEAKLEKAEHRPLIYLACPYSDDDPAIREQRFLAVNAVAARLMVAGHNIFSPISHTHPIAVAENLPKGWDFWEAYDRAMLSCCHKLIVLCLSGWKESKGVANEIKIAKEMGIEIEYIAADGGADIEAPKI